MTDWRAWVRDATLAEVVHTLYLLEERAEKAEARLDVVVREREALAEELRRAHRPLTSTVARPVSREGEE